MNKLCLTLRIEMYSIKLPLKKDINMDIVWAIKPANKIPSIYQSKMTIKIIEKISVYIAFESPINE